MIDEHTYNDGTWNNPDLSEPNIEELDDEASYLWEEEKQRASEAKTSDTIKRAKAYGLGHLIPITKDYTMIDVNNIGDNYEEHN